MRSEQKRSKLMQRGSTEFSISFQVDAWSRFIWILAFQSVRKSVALCHASFSKVASNAARHYDIFFIRSGYRLKIDSANILVIFALHIPIRFTSPTDCMFIVQLTPDTVQSKLLFRMPRTGTPDTFFNHWNLTGILKCILFLHRS